MRVLKKSALMIILFFSVILSCMFYPSKAYMALNETSVDILSETDIKKGDSYLDIYSIPSNLFTYSNNGGELFSNLLSYAFDRNFNTAWKCLYDNNVTNIIDGETISNFHNKIEINFPKKVSIDRILYQSENNAGRGYPISLALHFKNGGEDYIKTLNFESNATNNAVIFNFGETIECTGLTFEYVKVNTSHKYVATAREIVFLQPESDAMKNLQSLFTDYNKLTLNENYKDLTSLNSLRDSLKPYVNYEDSLSKIIDRAENIINGNLSYDKTREFSSLDGSLHQYGNIRNYCSGTLKMVYMGTNKQSTGVYALKGEVIKVYVEASDSAPLPNIVFSQYYSHYSNWQIRYSLRRGENTFVAPTFDETKLTNPKVLNGGPIYIENPYLSSEQVGSVKVYIEGGTKFPVYRINSDVNEFKSFLTDYTNSFDSETMLDLMEIEGNHFLSTTLASVGKNKYLTENLSPETNLRSWDNFVEELLKFDGVQFDENEPYYDERNKHINVNIRLAQPFGAAFAFMEQVGIFGDGWIGATVYSTSFGWGFAHEIGHCMDNPERTVSECSNNMMSKYDETALRKVAERGNFKETLENLASDRTWTNGYFNSNRLNFLVWWLVESYMPSSWAIMENIYRFGNYSTTGLNSTEKQIYYLSLATGIDLSYYFERFGYNLSTQDSIFSRDTASLAFKSYMQSAKETNLITDKIQPKLWYIDESYYTLNTENKAENIYDLSSSVEIVKVSKVEEGYSIILPTNSNPSHLGYEILEGNEKDGYEVIGFTKNQIFIDKSEYKSSYIPSYKIRAYDRTLSETGLSDSVQPVSQKSVCKIDNKFYNSIEDAIKNAEADNTIILLKDTEEGNLIFDKNLKLIVENNACIKRKSTGHLISIKANVTLTIDGSDKLTISGENINQEGSLVYLENGAVFNAQNLIFRDNITSLNGGAIYFEASTINITNVKFVNNQALNSSSARFGGAINCNAPRGRATITNCLFDGNKSNNGGAISNKGSITILGSEFVNNEALENGGGLNNNNGGVVYIKQQTKFTSNKAKFGGAIYVDGYTDIIDSKINSNIASIGGGIYHKTSTNTRKLIVQNSEVNANIADKADSIFISISNAFASFKSSSLDNNRDYLSIYVENGNVTFEDNKLSRIGVPTSTSFSKSVTKNSDKYDLVLTSSNISLTFKNLSGKDDLVDFEVGEDKYVSKDDIGLENNDDLVVKNQSKLTLNVGNKTKEIYVVPNSKINLPFEFDDLAENLYIDYFQNGDEKIYRETIVTITSDIVFVATIKEKAKVVIWFNEAKSQTNYLIPNSYFTIPNLEANFIGNNKYLAGWKNIKNNIFAPNSSILITEDMELKPIINDKPLITIKYANETVSYYVSPNTKFKVEEIEEKYQKMGSKFVGLRYGDKLYKIGDFIEIKGDMELIAEYEYIQKTYNLTPIWITIALLGVLSIVVVILFMRKQERRKK